MPTALALTTAASVLIGLPAPHDEPASDAARIAALEQRVAALRADDDPITAERAEAIRALVADLLADADTRAALLESDAAAGYDHGFFIGSADGAFRLKLTAQMQVRFVYNHQDAGSEDQDRWSFENRRTKIKFRGHVIDPGWRYGVTLSFSRSPGTGALQDAYIERVLPDGWSVKAGQFKPRFLREEHVSSGRQLAVDRSLVNARFTTGRTQGLQLAWEGDAVRVAATYHDGARNLNTAWSAEDTEYALTARAEALVSGTWSQFRDFNGWRGDDAGLLIGAGATYQRDEYGTPAGPEEEDLRLTLDASAEFDGASLFAGFVYQDLDAADRDPWALVVQGGLFLTDDWEAFARYEHGDDDSAADDLSVLTAGLNRYFGSHDLKWSMDVGYAFDGVDASWARSSLGWRADAPGDDGQIVVRGQLQLQF